ncbi:S-adenosylmethionine sensor upstream of mTORC1-like isoform X1 [Anneissia japonica]|uniref:S-adenosylmethionine sensor upstream of mTORC1-like isoform X1 n=1 Tax=Anneissia japonica TaxID=1529436 RepID=UPI0014255814|nr:S-adenosylmethionine sensor upstream of mTORC1-like isoform X1 [Anneissia japonica]XP_033098709.1 S-adenosylmethionine sensor upstream of mTORC1-like isoform X1 [Anneissia japonica]
MACTCSQEGCQQRTSEVVKGVHAKLRKKLKEADGDFQKIWAEHCHDEASLGEYAYAMQHLAVDHWSTKHQDDRIKWCYRTCMNYFKYGGMEKALAKDRRRQEHELCNGIEPKNVFDVEQSNKYNTICSPVSGQLRLLDVGSCFNPFLDYKEFLSVGIDLSPAVETVYRCDFLNLQIQEPLQVASDTVETYMRTLKNPVERLPKESFHIVVFSLLLSYFPSPYQRWICCQKAHELLQLNGLLLIVTPDSSHQNKHAEMVKSWKEGIEAIGFTRCKYEKDTHLHYMAFRKVKLKQPRYTLDVGPDNLYIPQDFSEDDDESVFCDSFARSKISDQDLSETFTELPGGDEEEWFLI